MPNRTGAEEAARLLALLLDKVNETIHHDKNKYLSVIGQLIDDDDPDFGISPSPEAKPDERQHIEKVVKDLYVIASSYKYWDENDEMLDVIWGDYRHPRDDCDHSVIVGMQCDQQYHIKPKDAKALYNYIEGGLVVIDWNRHPERGEDSSEDDSESDEEDSEEEISEEENSREEGDREEGDIKDESEEDIMLRHVSKQKLIAELYRRSVAGEI